MTYSDALILFCCNGIIVLMFAMGVELWQQREKRLKQKREEQNVEPK